MTFENVVAPRASLGVGEHIKFALCPKFLQKKETNTEG
jgi:hypothetical protein